MTFIHKHILPRPRPLRVVLLRVAIPLLILASLVAYFSRYGASIIPAPAGFKPWALSLLAPTAHPIEQLNAAADVQFRQLLAKESRSLEQAAEAYRARRGRHPPPGFDSWYRYATDRASFIIEDFFDPIYEDLAPFWGVDPLQLREEADCFEMGLKVREGRVSTTSDWFWTVTWKEMLEEIEHLLPDLDMAINAMDEPRIVAPWAEAEKGRNVERSARMFSAPLNIETRGPRPAIVKAKLHPQRVVRDFQALPERIVGSDDKKCQAVNERAVWLSEGDYWNISSAGCWPKSPALRGVQNTASYMHRGFVSNFTAASSVCENPLLRNSSGIFTFPLSIRSTDRLVPMFSGCKLETNNDIRIPAAMYLQDNEDFTTHGKHGLDWSLKENKAVWRGTGSGGKTEGDKWVGMQRHRFVYLNNFTSYVNGGPAHLPASKDKHFATWAWGVSDVRFTELTCEKDCKASKSYFELADRMSLIEQFGAKLLPDIDGNSYSGRYRAFLQSTSLPVKATIWKEWHDSRLIAWKHFVPMSYWFSEWWDIVQYFLGYTTLDGTLIGGDPKGIGKRIAMDGKAWAERVLRRDDMIIYTLRLLLEYARVSDPRREEMGWVDDLVDQ